MPFRAAVFIGCVLGRAGGRLPSRSRVGKGAECLKGRSSLEQGNESFREWASKILRQLASGMELDLNRFEYQAGRIMCRVRENLIGLDVRGNLVRQRGGVQHHEAI